MWRSSSGQETSTPHASAAVGDRQEVVDGVQLLTGAVGVVHARHAGADLEAERGVVAQHAGDGDEVLAAHVDRHLAAVDDDPVDGLGEGGGAADEAALEVVGDLVEVAAVGPLGGARDDDLAAQAGVAGRVVALRGAEHAVAHADDLGPGRAGRGSPRARATTGRSPGRGVGVRVAHAAPPRTIPAALRASFLASSHGVIMRAGPSSGGSASPTAPPPRPHGQPSRG